MASKGNPNFKSFSDSMPDVKSFISWFDTLKRNVEQSTTYHKQCSPWEIGDWEKREFRDFKIDVDKIDRLYHVRFGTFSDPICDIYTYHIYCRKDYKGRSLYFYLRTTTCTDGRSIHLDEAVLYLTFNVEVFVKAVVLDVCERQNIWRSMVLDGIVMENPSAGRYEIPSLKLLCHLPIFDNLKKLKYYPKVLPSCLTESIDQYIKIRKTQDHIDKYNLDRDEIYSDGRTDCDPKDGGLQDPWSCCHRQDHHDKYGSDESDTYSDCDFKDGGLRDTCSCCFRDDHLEFDNYDFDESDTDNDCYFKDGSLQDACSCWQHNDFLGGI